MLVGGDTMVVHWLYGLNPFGIGPPGFWAIRHQVLRVRIGIPPHTRRPGRRGADGHTQALEAIQGQAHVHRTQPHRPAHQPPQLKLLVKVSAVRSGVSGDPMFPSDPTSHAINSAQPCAQRRHETGRLDRSPSAEPKRKALAPSRERTCIIATSETQPQTAQSDHANPAPRPRLERL